MTAAPPSSDDVYSFQIEETRPRPTLVKNLFPYLPCLDCYLVDNPDPAARFYNIRYRGHRKVGFLQFWICYALLCYYFYFTVRHILPLDHSPYRLLSWIYCILWFSANINFLLVHEVNPGFLPWTLSDTKKLHYTNDELKEGIATRTEQVDWAKKRKPPQRTMISRKYGWFILRADHDCPWVDSFIGINNHHYFVKAVVSGGLLTLFGLGFAIFVAFTEALPVSTLHFGAMQVIVFLLGAFCLGQTRRQCHGLSYNETTVERIKKKWVGRTNPYNKDCLSNWEEVCGPRKYLPCWLLPIRVPGAFDGIYRDSEMESLVSAA